MPIVKNGKNKAQFEKAIIKSLGNEPPKMTKRQENSKKRKKTDEELENLYDNMHKRR